jgi:hypothetical protein
MNVVLFVASLACLLAGAVALVRFLPAQNVAFIIVFLAGVEVALEYRNGTEVLLDGAMFWPGAVILMRTSAQVLLKPWRQRRHYGLLLIGAASCAVAGLALAFDSPQAAISRFCVTAVCLLLLTPWFLQKRITASGESEN